MNVFRKELWFETSRQRQILNITPQVAALLKESGIGKGLLRCNAMHNGKIPNSKFQAPNNRSKERKPTKCASTIRFSGFHPLKIAWNLEVGIWSLDSTRQKRVVVKILGP